MPSLLLHRLLMLRVLETKAMMEHRRKIRLIPQLPRLRLSRHLSNRYQHNRNNQLRFRSGYRFCRDYNCAGNANIVRTRTRIEDAPVVGTGSNTIPRPRNVKSFNSHNFYRVQRHAGASPAHGVPERAGDRYSYTSTGSWSDCLSRKAAW